jgi:multidrug resistance efflux pump
VFLLLRKRLRKAWPSVLNAVRAGKEKAMAWRLTRTQTAGALGVIVLLTVPPTATTVATEFVLEPGERVEVRAPVAGWVAHVSIAEGESVPIGAVLATLSNATVTERAARATQQLALAERELMAARSRNDLGGVQRAIDARERASAEGEEAKAKLDALILRAPMAGVITTPLVETRQGEYLAAGADFARIVDRTHVHARILVRDLELEDVKIGAPAKLKTNAYPLRTFEGTVEQILPAAALDRPVSDPKRIERYGQELTNYFAVVLRFENKDGRLREGMTGTAKIYGKRYPLAYHWLRGGWRWLRSQVW